MVETICDIHNSKFGGNDGFSFHPAQILLVLGSRFTFYWTHC
jgi:hypothetical protein